MPKFLESTHYKNWIFTLEELRNKLQSRVEAFAASISQWVEGTNYLNYLLTPEEEEQMMLLLSKNITIAAPALNVPDKAISTAISYFRRFFLKYTPYEFDPFEMMFTALYVACKTEELNLTSSEYFCSFYKQSKPSSILKHEIVLVSGINFQLYVFSPFKCLEYALTDIQSKGTTNLDGVDVNAKEFIKNALLSDALFTETPSFIALAALYSATEHLMNRDEIIEDLVQSQDMQRVFDRIRAVTDATAEALAKLRAAEGKLSPFLKKAGGVRHRVNKARRSQATSETTE